MPQGGRVDSINYLVRANPDEWEIQFEQPTADNPYNPWYPPKYNGNRTLVTYGTGNYWTWYGDAFSWIIADLNKGSGVWGIGWTNQFSQDATYTAWTYSGGSWGRATQINNYWGWEY